MTATSHRANDVVYLDEAIAMAREVVDWFNLEVPGGAWKAMVNEALEIVSRLERQPKLDDVFRLEALVIEAGKHCCGDFESSVEWAEEAVKALKYAI